MYIKQGKMADPDQVYQLDHAIKFVAECMDMCPEYEREEREFTNYLEPFEKLQGTERVDHSKAVKRYKRSAAGDPPPLPCDVRPPEVLFKTLDYLFRDVIDTFGIQDSHSFVRDRARSIRNDLTLQNFRGAAAVTLHEKIARYHLMCSNIRCGSSGFVMQQEAEQVRKTLLSLMEFYSELNANQIHMPNEAEFQAYYILTFPWGNDLPSKLESDLREDVFFHPSVQLALRIRFLMAQVGDSNHPSVDGSFNHFSKIFALISKPTTSYLISCCVHLHFTDIRKGALRAIQSSYNYIHDDPSSGMLLGELRTALGFDTDEEATSFLNHYFIDVELVEGHFVAYVGRKVIKDLNGRTKLGDWPKYPKIIVPDNPLADKSELIESKRVGVSHIEILDGKLSSLPTTIMPQIAAPTIAAKATLPTQFSFTSKPQIFIPSITKPLQHIQPQKGIQQPLVMQPPLFTFNAKKSPIISKNINRNNALIEEDLLSNLINTEVEDTVSLYYRERKRQLQTDLASEMFEVLLGIITRDVARERYQTVHKVEIWRSVLKSIVSDLIDEVVLSQIRRVSKPLVIKKRHDLRFELFGFERWRYYVLLMKNKRRRRKEEGFRTLAQLGETYEVAVAPVEIIAGPDERIESRLAAMAIDMLKNRQTWYTQIDIQSQVLPLVSAQSRYKFVVGSGSNIEGSLAWFTETWMAEKLALNTPNNVFYPFGLSAKAASKRLHNSQSPCSGANGAIFHAEYYTASTTFHTYWSSFRALMAGFSSAFPLYCKIPLLVVYWPSLLMTETQFVDEIRNNIDFGADSPFKNIAVICLDISSQYFDSGLATNKLTKMLCWLFEESSREPDLKTDVMRRIPSVLENYEWSIRKVETLKSGLSDTDIDIRAFNCMIGLYNAFISQVVGFLTSDIYYQIPFPAVEYASFPLDWNTPESLDFLKELVVAAKLTPIPEAPFNNLIKVYAAFITNLTYIQYSESQALLSYISTTSLSVSEVFYLITNCTLSTFFANANIPMRPFLPSLISEFTSVSHDILSEFEKSDALLNKHQIIRKRKANLAEYSIVFIRRLEDKSLESASRKLLLAMKSAEDLIESLVNI